MDCSVQYRSNQSRNESYIMTGQSVCLGVRHPSGTVTISPLLSLIMFRQLQVCWCGVPSLTRSQVCNFQFLPGIARAAFLKSESHWTHDHILLSLFLRLPQPGGPCSCIYFPQEQGSPVIPSGTGFQCSKVNSLQTWLVFLTLTVTLWFSHITFQKLDLFLSLGVKEEKILHSCFC
jgi:hypothetical protein